MTIGLAYWILMLIWLALWAWPAVSAGNFAPGNLLLFVLLVLLGWRVFGAPIHG